MKKFESDWQKRQRKRGFEEAGKQQRCNIDQKFLTVKTRKSQKSATERHF